MLKNMKIGIKILSVLLVMSLGTLLIISVNSYLQMSRLAEDFQVANTKLGTMASEDSRAALEAQMGVDSRKIARKLTQTANEKLVRLRVVIDESVGYVENLYANPDQFVGHEIPIPEETEEGVSCSKYMLAPGVEASEEIQKQLRLISNCDYLFGTILENNPMMDNLYLGTEEGIYYRYSSTSNYSKDYDPRERQWYQEAMKQEDAIWLDTYTDYYGKTCLTCAKRICSPDGEVLGVLATDITSNELLAEIVFSDLDYEGYIFVLDGNLNYLAHPDYGIEGFSKSLGEDIPEDLDDLPKIKDNETGVVRVLLDGVDRYIAFSTFEETGWKLCVCVGVEEVLAPTMEIKNEIESISADVQEKAEKTLSRVRMQFILFFTVVGILVILLSFSVAGSITRPIQKLARNVKQIGEGNLDVRMEVDSRDEVGELALTFNKMLEDLQQYIKNLSEVTAEKERIGAELDVATNIQASMLPCIFPAFPDYSEFDIYATMNPAKEVGGDFYDFFLVDKNHLALVMADVSGKGVPAALFMVIAKTLIKNRAQLGESPELVLERVNNQLCENNDACMFVTVWLGIYELTTGTLRYANAGHDYPAVMRKGGTYEIIRESQDFVLGGFEGMTYVLHEMHLAPGDKLFLYTDGIPEATNDSEELFGEERMVEALNLCLEDTAEQTLHRVKAEVDTFVGEADQFDDMTMLSFEVKEFCK